MMGRAIKGTLVAATASQLQIATDANQTIFILIGNNTNVSITGSAEKEYLKAGMAVEFTAEIAKGGAVKEKVDHLTLVTISSDQPAGLLPPDPSASSKKAKADDGDNALPQVPELGGDEPAGKGRGPRGKQGAESSPAGSLSSAKTTKSRNTTPQLPGVYTVRGTIKISNKNGDLTVAPGRGPTIKAQISDDATIDVNMTDIRMAQRGDAVTVKGNLVRVGYVAAESVTIEMSSPLTGKKATKPTKPAATRSKAKKDTEGTDAP